MHKSERATMYESVLPKLDALICSDEYELYFEQPVGKDRVDLAIFSRGATRKLLGLIEVKAKNKQIDSSMVTKYISQLEPDTPLAVTNGEDWMFVKGDCTEFSLAGSANFSNRFLNHFQLQINPKYNAIHSRSLEEVLAYNLQFAQHSEKWVMYRLVLPIILEAILNTSIRYVFEEKILNRSLDLVLYDKSMKTILLGVETKYTARKLEGNELEKYLPELDYGVITNGVDWIVVDNSGPVPRYHNFPILSNGALSKTALSTLVSALQSITGKRSISDTRGTWHETWDGNQEAFKRPKPVNLAKFEKPYNQKDLTNGEAARALALLENYKIKPLAKEFAESLLKSMVNANSAVTFNASKSRLTWHHPNLGIGPKKRIGRVHFTKTTPEILCVLEIFNGSDELKQFENVPHGTTPKFQAIYCKDSRSAKKLGAILGAILINI